MDWDNVLTAVGSENIAIDDSKISAYIDSLPESIAPPHVGLPLRFSSVSDHVNFLSVFHLLQFGSGFSPMLKTIAKRGAFETIKYGMIAMHISGAKLNADFLRNISVEAVSGYFSIPLTYDAPIDNLPGVTMSKPAPVKKFAEEIAKILRDAGQMLFNFSLKDFFGLCERAFAKKDTTEENRASALVAAYCSFLSDQFRDTVKLPNGTTVVFNRKAQALVAELHYEISSEDPRFVCGDVGTLMPFADNVIPAVLQKLGIMAFTGALKETIDSARTLKKDSSEEIAIRVATMAACARIIKTAAEKGRKISGPELQGQLLLETNDKPFKEIKRHLTSADNIFY